MTTPGRLAGPSFVAQMWPDSVAPLRAVNSTGCTIPYPFACQSYFGSFLTTSVNPCDTANSPLHGGDRAARRKARRPIT